MNVKLKYYQKEATKSQMASADPYEIIQMLMAGVMDSLAKVKGAIDRRDYEKKAKEISKASAIINSLRSCLDMDIGGELSENLSSLYQYMIERLIDASVENNNEIIDEVANLFREIKSGWDSIPMSAREDAEKQRLSMVNAS